MSRGSSKGNEPRRYETQLPQYNRDLKTNWSWMNSNGTSNLNLKFEGDTGGTKSGEYKVPKEEI